MNLLDKPEIITPAFLMPGNTNSFLIVIALLLFFVFLLRKRISITYRLFRLSIKVKNQLIPPKMAAKAVLHIIEHQLNLHERAYKHGVVARLNQIRYSKDQPAHREALYQLIKKLARLNLS